MSAVAMVVGESDDLQLGFPSAYESRYAAKKIPLRAYPTAAQPTEEIMAGDDFQAQWHQQKKRDADYMSGARVQSTINSNARANVSAHGYYGMPKAVLGQRRFANPSLEALQPTSTRQDYAAAPFHYSDAHGSGSSNTDSLHGGVLRSAAGQAYGKRQLLRRVPQLNAIDEAKVQFQLGQQLVSGNVPAQMGFADSFATTPQLDTDVSTNLGLVRVTDLLMGADVMNNQESGFRSADEVFKETRSALGSILAMGATATPQQLSDTLGYVQKIEELLDATLDTDKDDPYMDEYANKQAEATYITLQEIYKKLDAYLKKMIEGAELQPRERVTLAKSTVKDLQLSKSFDVAVGRSREALSVAQRTGTPAARQDAMDAASRGSFSSRGTTRREDSEQGSRSGAPTLSGDENRSEFGYRSGDYFPTNGRSVGYFGDDSVGYAESSEASLPYRSSMRSVESAQNDEFKSPLASQPRGAPRAPSSAGPRQVASAGKTPQAPSSSVRGFFDPDTQAFNVSVADDSKTQSSKVSSDSVPVGLRSVLDQLKNAPPSPSSSVGRPARPSSRSRPVPRSPSSSTGKSVRPSNPKASSAAAAAPHPKAAYFRSLPKKVSEMPDTVEGLKQLAADLRSNGIIAPVIKGSAYSPGDPQFKDYLRKARSNLLLSIQAQLPSNL